METPSSFLHDIPRPKGIIIFSTNTNIHSKCMSGWVQLVLTIMMTVALDGLRPPLHKWCAHSMFIPLLFNVNKSRYQNNHTLTKFELAQISTAFKVTETSETEWSSVNVIITWSLKRFLYRKIKPLLIKLFATASQTWFPCTYFLVLDQ